jgi:hypothetical protein
MYSGNLHAFLKQNMLIKLQGQLGVMLLTEDRKRPPAVNIFRHPVVPYC